MLCSVFFFRGPLQCDDAGGSTGGRENEDLFIREILNICNAKIFYVRCFNFSLIVYLSFISMCNIIVLVFPFRFSPRAFIVPFLSLSTHSPRVLILSSYQFVFSSPLSSHPRRWWIDERASIGSSRPDNAEGRETHYRKLSGH